MTDTTATEDPSGAPRRRPPQRGRVRSEYQWDRIRGTLHEMLMARRPLGQIAEVFEVSEKTIRHWRDRMHDEMRPDYRRMQPHDYALEVMDGLRTAIGEAWMTYRGADTPKAKVAALHLYLKSLEQQHQFNQSVGVYGQRGAQPLHPASSGDTANDGANSLAAMAKEFLSALRDERDGVGTSGGVSWDDILGPGEGDDLLPLEDRELPETAASPVPVVQPGEADTDAMPSPSTN